MANETQKEHWAGAGGQRWVANAARYDRMMRHFRDELLAALDPVPGELILDVGCGNGALSIAVAEKVAPGGSVTALDISTPMLDEARRRSDEATLTNVTFREGDAQVEPLPLASFDAVTSRFGVMFFDDPVAAFTNLAGALKLGGRMVFTCWRDLLRNDWLMVPAGAALQHVPMPDMGEPGGPGPFAFADADRLREILGEAGVRDVTIDEVVHPMWIGESVDDALAFMQHGEIAEALMKDVPEDTVARAWSAVREAIEPHAGKSGLELNGTAWLVTGRRAA